MDSFIVGDPKINLLVMLDTELSTQSRLLLLVFVVLTSSRTVLSFQYGQAFEYRQIAAFFNSMVQVYRSLQ